MALATRCKASAAVGAARSRRSVQVCCQKGALEQAHIAAGVVALSLVASPAYAGITFENKPILKKLFQDDSPPPAPVKREFRGLQDFSLPSAPAPDTKAEAPKAEKPKPAPAEINGDLDPRSIALPGALALTIGGFLAASRIDGGLNDWFIEAVVKDSNKIAAGYEPNLKTEGMTMPNKSIDRARIIGGTKKVKATAGTKKGGLFGKKN